MTGIQRSWSRRIVFFILLLIEPNLLFAWHPSNSKKLDIQLTPEIGEVFDDNVTYTKDKEWDLITELALGLGIKHEGRRHKLDFLGRDKQQFFARNSRLNNNSQDARLDFLYDVTDRDHIALRDRFAHFEDPRSFEESFGRPSGRFAYTQNQAGAEYTRDLGERFSTALRYDNHLNFVSGGGSDSYVHKAGADFNFFKSSATLFSLLYEFTYAKFEKAQSAKIHTAAARARRYLTKQLYVESKAGIDIIDSFSNDKFVRPLFSVSLDGDLDKTTHARLLFETSTSTNPFTMDIFEYLQASASLRREFTKRLSGEVSGFYGHGRYREFDIKDNYWGASAGLAYQFPNDFQVKLSYTFSAVESNAGIREYTKNVVGLKLLRVF